MRRIAVGRVLFALAMWVLLAGVGGRGPVLAAADGDGELWAGEEARTQDLLITLKTGDTVRGRFSAETADKVMLSVLTDKGKTAQTVKKADVKTHDWVPHLEEEVKAKLLAWPADRLGEALPYAQGMCDKGLKKICVDALKERQKDLTAESLEPVGVFFINNDSVSEARELVAWAKKEHADWAAAIAAVSDRLPAVAADPHAAPVKQEVGDVGEAPSKGVWGTGFEKAKALAEAEHKPILVVFEGSDWSEGSLKFEHDVLNTAKFKTWAGDKVVLLKVDFPRRHFIPPLIKAQNDKLAESFKVKTYPCALFLDAAGKPIGERNSYVDEGLEKWMAYAEGVLAKVAKE